LVKTLLVLLPHPLESQNRPVERWGEKTKTKKITELSGLMNVKSQTIFKN